MGAADGAIFTRHRVNVGGFDISYLQGGHDGPISPVLSLHGMGGAGKWEAYHMALGTIARTYVPQLPGWPEGRPPAGITSVGEYTALVPDHATTCQTIRDRALRPLADGRKARDFPSPVI
jgi:hypothetical protein